MPYDWRLNPYQCIECETRQQACRCCDNGQDSIPFVVVIDGCGTFAGRYEFDAVRYKSPTALPTGVSYPATNPCGVFWGTLSAGDGCTANGATWSGSLGLLSWCDGSDPYYGMPWHVEVFCYDTYLGAWVSQGEATVTSYECLCSGPRFAFTLPEIDCCCDGGGPVDCNGCNTPATATLTIDVLLGSGCSDTTVVSLTRNGCNLEGTFTRHGILRFIRINWTGTTWRMQYWNNTTNPPTGSADYDQTSTSSPVCDPPYATWTANDPNYCGIGLGISSLETLSA